MQANRRVARKRTSAVCVTARWWIYMRVASWTGLAWSSWRTSEQHRPRSSAAVSSSARDRKCHGSMYVVEWPSTSSSVPWGWARCPAWGRCRWWTRNCCWRWIGSPPRRSRPDTDADCSTRTGWSVPSRREWSSPACRRRARKARSRSPVDSWRRTVASADWMAPKLCHATILIKTDPVPVARREEMRPIAVIFAFKDSPCDR